VKIKTAIEKEKDAQNCLQMVQIKEQRMENMKLKIQEKTREKVQLETHIAREEARVAEMGTTLATYK